MATSFEFRTDPGGHLRSWTEPLRLQLLSVSAHWQKIQIGHKEIFSKTFSYETGGFQRQEFEILKILLHRVKIYVVTFYLEKSPTSMRGNEIRNINMNIVNTLTLLTFYIH